MITVLENDASCDYKTSCESIRRQKVASNRSWRLTDVQCFLNHLFEHLFFLFLLKFKKKKKINKLTNTNSSLTDGRGSRV